MKGLVLAGGRGTRLRPLTHSFAKQLVPVANKPVLYYGIEALAAAGIRDIGVVVGSTGAEIRRALGDGGSFGVSVTYIEQEAPLGLAHAVLISEEYMAGEPFVMYLGDNILAGGIASLVEEFVTSGVNAEILLSEVEDAGRFGVAELGADGRVIGLQEKPQDPPSRLALVGVYMFDASIFDAVRRITPSQRGELEITDAIQQLIDGGASVLPHIVEGWWKDTGKLSDLLEANRLVLETLDAEARHLEREDSRIDGRVRLGTGVELVQAVVRGPAVIGDGTRLENCFVGPYTSIGERCRITRCEIENSIVFSDSSLEDVPARVERSLIGRGSRVTRSRRRPRSVSFIMGDDSEVELS